MTNWTEATVIDLANGKREFFNDGDWIEAPFITTSGNRLLQTGNVGVGQLLDRGTKRYVSDESFRSLQCKEVILGDILICRLADPAGRACLVHDIGEKRMLTSVDVTIYRPNPQKADRRFLVALFSMPAWFQEVNERCGGSTRTRIARSELGKIPLLLPPIDEQVRIADALADIDNLIATLERLIAKKQAIKQGMMQQLLTGRIRLPGFTDRWGVTRLGEHFEITSSKRIFQREWRSSGVPFYRARELAVLGETGAVDNDLFIDRALFEKYKRLHGAPSAGDFLVTGVGTLGKTYVVGPADEFYFKDGNIIWFKRSDTVDSGFLKYLFETPQVQDQVHGESAGTTVGTYTITNAKRTGIPLVPIEEQRAIAIVLQDMDSEVAVIRAQLGKARAIKTGMMQQLLTGRTRLPVEATS
ncbi:restriction endonuclease subunit S [Rhodococcus aetherivorans]